MKLAEALSVSAQYEKLFQRVSEKTDDVFEELTALYRKELDEAGKSLPELIEIPEQDAESRFDFKIRGISYTLFQNREPALVKDLKEFADVPDVFSHPIRHVVENDEIRKHFAGCISLLMKFESQYSTLFRLFVNDAKEVAWEYAIGWKQPFLFQSFDGMESKAETFFTEPVTQSILAVTPKWKTLDEIEIVDDIRDLITSDNRIGFIQASD